MNIKAMVEKHNSLLDEIDALYETGVLETRSLTQEEEAKIEELRAKAEELKNEIEAEEKRSVEETTKVEERKEEVVMENTMELELRGMEDFLRGVDSEEVRAMTTTDGAGIIPKNLDRNIIKKLEEVAPLFNMVPKFTPVAGTLSIPVEDDLGTAGFVGEDAGTSESKFKLKTVDLSQRRAGSEITLSQFLINDAGIDIVAYAEELLTRRLGHALDRAMITGTVAGKSIEGLESVDAASEIQASTGLSIDVLVGAMASMKAAYQGGAKWIMNRKTFEEVAKLKDETGNLYVVRDVVNGQVLYKLFSLELVINDAVADNEIFLANIAQAYRGMVKKGASITKIADDTQNRRAGTVTLVLDTYVDARIVQPEAIRRIKITPAMLLAKKK